MDKGKKEKVTEMEKNFQNTLSSIVSSEKDNKKLLEGVKIENAREVEIEKGERCFLVCVNTADEKDLRKIHPTLVKKFEEQFSAPVALIPAKKRVNGKLYKRYRGTKVPRGIFICGRSLNCSTFYISTSWYQLFNSFIK